MSHRHELITYSSIMGSILWVEPATSPIYRIR